MFSIKDFFSKCDQICRKLPWSHLLKKSLMKNFVFCAVLETMPLPKFLWATAKLNNESTRAVTTYVVLVSLSLTLDWHLPSGKLISISRVSCLQSWFTNQPRHFVQRFVRFVIITIKRAKQRNKPGAVSREQGRNQASAIEQTSKSNAKVSGNWSSPIFVSNLKQI